MMFGSVPNLLSAALGFGMTAVFVGFVCARFLCYRARGTDGGGAQPALDFDADFPADLDRPVRALPFASATLISAAQHFPEGE